MSRVMHTQRTILIRINNNRNPDEHVTVPRNAISEDPRVLIFYHDVHIVGFHRHATPERDNPNNKSLCIYV